jgi:Transglycosylase
MLRAGGTTRPATRFNPRRRRTGTRGTLHREAMTVTGRLDTGRRHQSRLGVFAVFFITCVAVITFVAAFFWVVTSPEYRMGRDAIRQTAGLRPPPANAQNAVIAAERPWFWSSGVRGALRETVREVFFRSPTARRWLSVPNCTRICSARRIGALLLLRQNYGRLALMRAYLWTVPMGNIRGRNLIGLGSAADAYFGIDLWALPLAECATLAAIIRSPVLSPITDPERAVARRNVVLRLMLDHGMITNEEYKQAAQSVLRVAAQLRTHAARLVDAGGGVHAAIPNLHRSTCTIHQVYPTFEAHRLASSRRGQGHLLLREDAYTGDAREIGIARY